MNSNINFCADNQSAHSEVLMEKDAESLFQKFQGTQILVPNSRNTTEYPYEWSDDSDRRCSDCPDDECTGHCTSCSYRPV